MQQSSAEEGTDGVVKPSGEDEADDDLLEQKETELFFSPEKGNVAFSSALDCWAFNLTMFSRKLA
jgi:hypothetical protein